MNNSRNPALSLVKTSIPFFKSNFKLLIIKFKLITQKLYIMNIYTVNQFEITRIFKEIHWRMIIYKSFTQTKEIMFTIIL